jgi:hypothetical protein
VVYLFFLIGSSDIWNTNVAFALFIENVVFWH